MVNAPLKTEDRCKMGGKKGKKTVDAAAGEDKGEKNAKDGLVQLTVDKKELDGTWAE